MRSKSIRLLIHHHHLAYLDGDGTIWLSSVIGRWVDALADHLGEVGLLMYENELRLPQQDTHISKNNINFYSLGPRRTLRKRIFRRSRVRKVCEQAGTGADGLLIRGITPHQFKIWRSTPVENKAFLLVGSLKKDKKKVPLTLKEGFSFFLRSLRLNELRWIAGKGTLMLANSPELVFEIGEVLRNHAYFVPTNSIRLNEFSPLYIRQTSNPRKLLYCGRLDFKKGLRELIQALAILNQQEEFYQLDIVGAQLEPVFSKLQELANDLGVENQIQWHGLVPYGPNLFAFYRQADALVLPSYIEGFPHVIWEAMANSCPVIATSVGGIPALIQHGEHALFIPPKDVKAIVNAVKHLLADDVLRRKLVAQAYHHALGFTVEVCAQKLAAIIQREWN